MFVLICEHSISMFCVHLALVQVKKQEERNGKLQSHLAMFREILVTMFKDVPLPGDANG